MISPVLFRLQLCTAFGVLCLSGCERSGDGYEEQRTLAVLKLLSPLPEPAESPYPNCLQVAHVHTVRNWPDHLEQPPAEGVLLAWRGFVNRQLTEDAALAVGDALAFDPIPWDNVGDSLRSTPMADSIETFDLPLYFVEQVEHVADFRDEDDRQSGDEKGRDRLAMAQPALKEIAAMPVGRTLDDVRGEVIHQQIGQIEKLAASQGGWDAWQEAMKPFYDDLSEKSAAAGGLNQGHHFFERTYDHRFAELLSLDEPPALKMLLALDRDLARKGIDLLVVPFPLKEEINADLFLDREPAAAGHLSPNRLRCLLWLLNHGVEVVDLGPEFREQRDSGAPLFYDFEDHHPAQGGIDLAARVIAERLQRYSFRKTHEDLQQKSVSFAMPELFRERFEFDRDPATYSATRVLQDDGTPLPGRAGDSPILLVGDSFTRVPMLYGVSDAGLRERLALETGVLPQTLSTAGSAAKLMRNIRREGPGFLEHVKVCVFVFAEYPMFETVDDAGNLVPGPIEDHWEIVPLP